MTLHRAPIHWRSSAPRLIFRYRMPSRYGPDGPLAIWANGRGWASSDSMHKQMLDKHNHMFHCGAIFGDVLVVACISG
jgi:hypothetical protein